ncbi:MAG: hypothetical protein N2044_01565 [Cyclobacteriaceae bacterium]|nr:hypothetical protein [Cyclobacteriaceae bacterium]MCX7636511.1 hypothetical protein [Cyclobacteriaceae bacterium]MDW8330543.1 HmuY family protein [Cyclobacteriaceae bacterium]
MMNKLIISICVVGCSLLFLTGCKEDVSLPDNLVQFESDTIGISEDENDVPITITLSRAVSTESVLTIQLQTDGVTYGTDFTTNPPASDGVLTLTVPANSANAQFTITKSSGVLLDGDETITFSITNAPSPLVIGPRAQLTVSFSEIIASSGSMEINGGGPTYPNRVFIDLSANRQTAVQRTTWDLAFYTGSDFKVLLNSSNGMMARALNKTDLNAVTASDTVGWGRQLSLSAVFSALVNPTPEWVAQSINWIDNPSNPLGDPAIDPISATASENKVYIVNRGTGPGSTPPALGWKKIRILRNGGGYTLQFADIAATTFTEVQISKNTQFGFIYVSLSNGAVVNVEPPIQRWDIAWNGFTGTTPFNSTNLGTITVPYYYQDMIIQNLTGVETAQVLTSTVTYEAFAEANLASVDFTNQNQIRIGSNWRTTFGGASVRTDRFYVIKDQAGNYYKLRFTALTTDGQRGRPRFEFALVKRGS